MFSFGLICRIASGKLSSTPFSGTRRCPVRFGRWRSRRPVGIRTPVGGKSCALHRATNRVTAADSAGDTFTTESSGSAAWPSIRTSQSSVLADITESSGPRLTDRGHASAQQGDYGDVENNSSIQHLVEGCKMSKKIKTAAATVMALPLLVLAAPAASADSTSAATPAGGGSVAICFPLGSVVWCI